MSEKKIRMATPENPEEQGHTIVGGRPAAPRSIRNDIPRGLELLIKKASVDPDFKRELLSKKEKLIGEMNLPLDESEKAMLTCVPVTHLEKMIEATQVSASQRKALSGGSAAAMLALLTQLTFAPVAGRAESPENNRTTNEQVQVPPLNQTAVLLTGIRPDETGEKVDESQDASDHGQEKKDMPSPQILPPVVDDYDDHLADRGARPDFPEIYQELIKEEQVVDNFFEQPEKPFDQILEEELEGKTVAEALQKLSDQSGFRIEINGLDEVVSTNLIEEKTSGKNLAEVLKTICNEIAAEDYKFKSIFEPENSLLKIDFRVNLQTVPAPSVKPDFDDSAICRGIRSDMPGIKKKLDFDHGDGK
jgi:hypothetical protein